MIKLAQKVILAALAASTKTTIGQITTVTEQVWIELQALIMKVE